MGINVIDHHVRLSTQDRHCVKVTCVYAVSEEKEKKRLNLWGWRKDVLQLFVRKQSSPSGRLYGLYCYDEESVSRTLSIMSHLPVDQ